MNSLRARLIAALVGALLAVGLAASAATYLSARVEVGALLDEQLRQVALSLRDVARLDLRALGRAADPGQQVVVQVWDPTGGAIYASDATPPLPLTRTPGFTTIDHDGRRWRMFTALAGLRTIQVAQPTALRTQLAAEAALRILLPVLAALPLLGALVWLLVGRGLAPLSRLAQGVAGRSPTSLEALPAAGLPQELQPLVGALNGLLARLDDALTLQRRFAADAAHELRTPLTALGLQIQLVERARDDGERARAIERLKQGVRRATRLVEQLLTLARLEPEAAGEPATVVALDAVVRGVVADLEPLAQAKPVALVLARVEPVRVAGSDAAWRILAANLVDNAIRYTPAGGHVEVHVAADDTHVVLEVADDGPGIPGDERERVFDRFVRGAGVDAPGSGLGLAIVRQVAQLHGAAVTLGDGPGGRGLAVRVTVPLAR
ncbi:MAG: ATP-binding protein [Burkholderiaceae bacterium]|nr:ATP-binding protein [Burkholderiaceae bacterium]